MRLFNERYDTRILIFNIMMLIYLSLNLFHYVYKYPGVYKFNNLYNGRSLTIAQVFHRAKYGYVQRNAVDTSSSAQQYENRKVFRWVYHGLTRYFYDFVGQKYGPSVQKFIISSILLFQFFLGYLFSLLLFSKISLHGALVGKSKNSISLTVVHGSYFILLFLLTRPKSACYEWYTPLSFFCISACLYFALSKKFGPFLLVALLGVFNRESGVLLGCFYPLLNLKDSFWKTCASLFVPAAVLLSANLDVLSHFFMRGFLTLSSSNHFISFSSVHLFAALKMMIPFSLPFLLVNIFKNHILRKLSLLLVTYLAMLLVFTPSIVREAWFICFPFSSAIIMLALSDSTKNSFYPFVDAIKTYNKFIMNKIKGVVCIN